MRKSIRTFAICVAFSIIFNCFPNGVGAESPLWGLDKNAELFKDNMGIMQPEVADEENDFVEPYIRLIIKYTDGNGDKVIDDTKQEITPYYDTVDVASDTDIETYMANLKAGCGNIAYVQKDYKLILSDFDRDEVEISPREDIMIDATSVKTFEGERQTPLDFLEVSGDDFENKGLDDIVVAVVDSGIDIEHEALRDNIWVNQNENSDETDTDNNGFVDDICGWDFVNNKPLSYEPTQIVEYSHGTHVSGIIAGKSDEIQGAKSNAKIMALKAFENGMAYTSDVIKAIEYANNMDASVVNCSFGSDDENIALKEVIEESNMVFVCAAGNRAKNIDESPVYPASYDFDNVISVAASDENGNLAYFSNYGDTVDVAANGCSVSSSVPENEYGNSSGTSSAAAYVSGVVAENLFYNKLANKESILGGITDVLSIRGEPTSTKCLIAPIENELSRMKAKAAVSTVSNNPVTEYGQIKQISAGGYHSVALIDENVYTFGCNDHNQCSGMYYFGEGNFSAPGNSFFAVGPPYGSSISNFRIKKVSTRGDHTLILLKDGTVRSYGANSYGQLGIGYVGGENITDAYEPTEQVIGLSNIVDIAAGHQFSMALDSSGRVYAWGNNKNGQVGNGNTYPFFTTAQLVSGISNIESISAGHYHALAQNSSGTVYGWGKATTGAFGFSAASNNYTPTTIPVDNVEKAVAGLDNSFFIKTDGTVYACGNNSYGQLGDGTITSRNTISAVNISNVADISSNFSTVFLKSDGSVYGCGANAYGQLGLGYTSTIERNICHVPGTYLAVSTGGSHTLFLKENGLYSAGRNHMKQCGFENTSVNYIEPTLIQSLSDNAFTVDNVEVNYITNKLIISGRCDYDDTTGRVYVGSSYALPASNSSSSSVNLNKSDGTYTAEYPLSSTTGGTYNGWISLTDYSCKIYFSFEYSTVDNSEETTVTITNGTPYIYAVTVSDMENIQNKIFTVNFDNSKLSLVDACAQTWGNDVSIGDVADTDIRILAVTSSSVKFKVNKTQSPVSGCVNLIKFNALTSGTTTITVTTEN